ncbi:MAG: co-chaperone GroES [Fibrobacteria bacterium]|nr:co-chaperone GroES [Fibrobacteria bacterium]
MKTKREIIIIGDRILVSADLDKDRTDSGLYLPQGLAIKEKIQGGYAVKTGPGYIVPHSDVSESWDGTHKEVQYIPLQVKEGDYVIFLRKEAVEIEYEKKSYLIVPQAGVVALVREDIIV